MHKILSQDSLESDNEVILIEQLSASVHFLSSASTDISTLSETLKVEKNAESKGTIRSLLLQKLDHPAKIDHYINSSLVNCKLILIRLLGGRGHWSYGLEQLKNWQEEDSNRKLIVLSGAKENFMELHEIGNVDTKYSNHLADLLLEGGIDNMQKVIDIIIKLIRNSTINLNNYKIVHLNEPYKWDWRAEAGKRIAVIHYKSIYQSSNLEFPIKLNSELRKYSFSPRTLFVTSLRNKDVLASIHNIINQEEIYFILTTTSFSWTNSNLSNLRLKNFRLPIIQLISSTSSYEKWNSTSQGLSTLDLTLQIALPEMDGKIITRPCAFKNIDYEDESLQTSIEKIQPHNEGIDWIVRYIRKYEKLQTTHNRNKKICIVLGNYPVKNGRIANGVGLNTPESVIQVISWLKESGYYLGDSKLPIDGNQLINQLLSNRTNDKSSYNKPALCYLLLGYYLEWWNKQSSDVIKIIESRWGSPSNSKDLTDLGFPILGYSYGNITILIQPSRSYDMDNLIDIHSPDLPPPHEYLAQYLWISKYNDSNAIIHIGKHGTVEWLPGKNIGMSNNCHTSLALGSIPIIYPFIVNDPGEGSQAKRRSHAVIVDHLTPPLDRSELYGDLLKLEGLIDEFYEASDFMSKRLGPVQESINELLIKLNLPLSINNKNYTENISQIETYLCELKELQIRTGLHTFGVLPIAEDLISLIVCIVRTPRNKRPGITQILASTIGLEFDPWIDEVDCNIDLNDKKLISKYLPNANIRSRNIIDWLEKQANYIVKYIYMKLDNKEILEQNSNIIDEYLRWMKSPQGKQYIEIILNEVINPIVSSPSHEKQSLIDSLNGKGIQSGPSGAPSRGRTEVLPTGKNFYSVDLRGLPTEAAWDLGRRSALNILELYLQEEGQHLTNMALSVWGTSTMRNGGEDICQLLFLLGVQPIWDGPTRRFIDLEVIPISILQRPRVDITLRISGLFRDAFPNLVNCVSRAQKLIRNLNEPTGFNQYADSVKKGGSPNRIYGSSPNSYGAGLQHLIDSGNWDSSDELAKAYISWSKWSYDGIKSPSEDLNGLLNSLSKVQLVMHNQDNREHDILDSDDYYQFHGGLSATVKYISGQQPEVFFGDNSNIHRPKVHKLEKEIDKVVRSRVLNPKWIKGMKKNGYKGCFEMSATVDYLFAYDATTGMVPNWCYSEICSKWINDENTFNFLLTNNPWVLRDIAERLLEASNRGLWKDITDSECCILNKAIYKSEYEIEKS